MAETLSLDLRREVRVSARVALAATAFAGVMLGLLAEPLSILVPGGLAAVLIEVLVAVAWAVDQWRPRVGPWLAVANLVAIVFVLQGILPTPGMLPLLVIPAALAASLIGLRGAAATAAVETILLLGLTRLRIVAADPGDATVALIATWSILGVMLATYQQVYAFARWSWDHFREAQRLLEEARDRRGELKRALEDVAAANLQLTRLNHLTQSLRQAAEEAVRAKEQFVANVSHELRTPLNMIIGFSEMVLQAPEAYGGRIAPTLLADLDVILRNSQHLADLIDDVLDLSQVEAGRMALTKERVGLAEIVEGAVGVVRPLFESKALSLKVSLAGDLPPILCDRTRIREVLVNLLSNAGRFTERGGVGVRVWREGNDVVLSVSDTGPGISLEDMGKVFRPFQQLDGSIRRRHGGSGLGLSISRAFVELHGGRMWFASEKGQGTTFYFRLPIDPLPSMDDGVGRWFSPYLEYDERPRRLSGVAPALRPRYVVVEARDALCRLLTRYVNEAEIVSVTTLDQALEELRRVPAQALLVNEASVAGSLQQLLRDDGLPYGTPVLICSVPGASEAADALGAEDYLVKPVSGAALLAAVDRAAPESETILVVDDDQEALQLFHRMLGAAGRGYRVLRASDGRQALDIMRAARPGLVLLDLVMPDMDGFQLLAAKNEDAALRDIPTVVISARDPAGQPIIASALAITRGGGLSTSQLLGCIQAVTRLLSPATPPADPGRPAGPAG